jgi:hypothetical protein
MEELRNNDYSCDGLNKHYRCRDAHRSEQIPIHTVILSAAGAKELAFDLLLLLPVAEAEANANAKATATSSTRSFDSGLTPFAQDETIETFGRGETHLTRLE